VCQPVLTIHVIFGRVRGCEPGRGRVFSLIYKSSGTPNVCQPVRTIQVIFGRVSLGEVVFLVHVHTTRCSKRVSTCRFTTWGGGHGFTSIIVIIDVLFSCLVSNYLSVMEPDPEDWCFVCLGLVVSPNRDDTKPIANVCRQCPKRAHQECFDSFLSTRLDAGGFPTDCPFCREPLPKDVASPFQPNFMVFRGALLMSPLEKRRALLGIPQRAERIEMRRRADAEEERLRDIFYLSLQPSPFHALFQATTPPPPATPTADTGMELIANWGPQIYPEPALDTDFQSTPPLVAAGAGNYPIYSRVSTVVYIYIPRYR
jgi:hypothetical protein